jgi:hypothetical protein
MIATLQQPRQVTQAQRDERFLEMVPAIERHAQVAFRNLQPQAREEAICSVLADAFCAYRRLAELGKQDMAYAIPLVRYAVARYRAGRCIANRTNSRDVSALVAQRRRGFRLDSLDRVNVKSTWADMLADNTLTPIPDQVAFRLDFPAWLRGLSRRDRKLARFLALGNTTAEAAQRFGVTPGRVSQLRRALERDWQAFQNDATPRPSGQGESRPSILATQAKR